MNCAKAVITIAIIAAMILTTTTTTAGLQKTYASSNPLTAKEEFDVTVTNIGHRNIIVGVTIDGLTKTQLIPGNPPFVIPASTKVVLFQFDRHNGATPPTPLPIKLGDEWDPCIKFSNDTHTSCLRASIDSLSQPQKKTLDTRYIPF